MMTQRLFLWSMVVLIIVALACSLGGGGSAGGHVSLEAATSTPVSATELPVVEDVEKVRRETPQATPTQPIATAAVSVGDTIVMPSRATARADNNETHLDNEGEEITLNGNVPASEPISATPSPTYTPTPTLTPTLSAWPPILPNALNFDSGAGYVNYATNQDITTAVDFYRQEMARNGWAEIETYISPYDPEKAKSLGLEQGPKDLPPFPVEGRIEAGLIFSNGGGSRIIIVTIVKEVGPVSVSLTWPTE